MVKRRFGMWIGAVLFVVVLLVAGILAVDRIKDKGNAKDVFFVPNAADGTVSKVDYVSGKVVDTIHLGSEEASHGIALSQDGTTLYTGTGFKGKELLAVDVSSKAVRKRLPFDEGVHGIDLSPDGRLLFVSLNPGLGEQGGSLAIVDAATLSLLRNVPVGNGPAHVAVTSDGKQVWTADVNNNTVSVVDVASQTMIRQIPVGEVPNEVAVTPDGKLAFAANVKSNTVSVIDTRSYQVVHDMQAGNAPHGVSITPDGTQLWVANNDSNDVTVIDLSLMRVLATIPTGAYANHVAFSPDGKWAFVSNRSSNDIVKISVADRRVTARIPVGQEPHEISLEDNVYPLKTAENNAASTNSERQTGTIVGVEVEIERLEPSSAKSEKRLTFQLSLTAHSGDISSLLNADNVSLSDGQGGQVRPDSWNVITLSAHHPVFQVSFDMSNLPSSGQVLLNIKAPSGQVTTFTFTS